MSGRQEFVLTLPFIILKQCKCVVCKTKYGTGVLALKIIVGKSILICFTCETCAQIDSNKMWSYLITSAIDTQALKPWVSQKIKDSHDIASFVKVCNANKLDGLKVFAKQAVKKCMCCEKAKAKFRCSICHAYRFCGAECAKTEWKGDSMHKLKCQKIAKESFIRSELKIMK